MCAVIVPVNCSVHFCSVLLKQGTLGEKTKRVRGSWDRERFSFGHSRTEWQDVSLIDWQWNFLGIIQGSLVIARKTISFSQTWSLQCIKFPQYLQQGNTSTFHASSPVISLRLLKLEVLEFPARLPQNGLQLISVKGFRYKGQMKKNYSHFSRGNRSRHSWNWKDARRTLFLAIPFIIKDYKRRQKYYIIL